MKKRRNKFLAGFLATTMLLCSASTLSAVAEGKQQKAGEPYPYTIFAASEEEGAITIDANNFCVNGTIATNGTISTSGNVNINGKKLEQADEDMIYIFDAIDKAYFTGTGFEEHEEDYSLTEQNININVPVEVKGELSLDGNINLTTAVKVLEDISLNGEVKNTDNSILFSKYGDIVIDSTNVNLNGLVYAPFGCVDITAQNLTLNNIIIIAQEVRITCGSVNANYSNSMARFVGSESEALHIPEDEQKYLEGKDIPGVNNPEESETEENSSEEGDSEENSSEESGSEEENSREEEAFWDLLSRYDEWADMEDTDGDGLPDAVEKVVGSRIDITDTDGDGLDDYYEVMVLGTSPTAEDTDENGIADPDEDFDEDGLSNYEEYLLDTYPWEPDTDEDNLSDGDEVHVYGTDPHIQDSDTDGLLDGDEPALGTDPLNPDSDGDGILDGDERYEQTYVYEVKHSEECAVSQVIIEMEATGNLKSTTTIESIMGRDVVCSNVVGLVGEPFEIETISEFDTAKLTFIVDPSKLGDVALSDLLFLWYDEGNGQFVELETTCDEETGAVSTETTHFSSYLLVDSKKWFEAWEIELDYGSMDEDEEILKGAFTHIAIDLSSPKNLDRGFDLNEGTDPEIIKKSIEEDPPYDPMAVSICEALIENMKPDDVMSMTFFTTHRNLLTAEMSYEQKELLYEQLDEINKECFIGAYSHITGEAYYQDQSYIDGYSGYSTAISACSAHGYDHINYLYGANLYIISSGKGKIEEKELFPLNFAKENKIHINTIAVGEYADVEPLQYIADYTGGKCYVISEPEDIYEFLEDININVYDSTDSDEDGIPDIMEVVGMRNQWGEIVYTDPHNPDSDYDGLKDGEEVDIQVRIKTDARRKEELQDGDPYFYMYSHPRRPDTDGDGYMDEDEIRVYGSNPWKPDVEIYQLSQEFIHVDYKGGADWSNFGSSISYGGDQGWFVNLKGANNHITERWGCGLISPADILLYLSMSNSEYKTMATDLVEYATDSWDIEYESYMNYLSYLERAFFHVHWKLGIFGPSIAEGYAKYAVLFNKNIQASWCMSKDLILPRIKEMLRNDIPVTLSAGPSGKGKVLLYRKDTKSKDPYKFNITTDNAKFVDHYLTVTGLIVDDIKGDTWLEVSSWGRCYYINYDQYIYFVEHFSPACFSNIVYISK